MFNNANIPSLADIAAVTKDNDGGFGGNNGWWILIILFALFGGWGAGWGGGGYGGGGAVCNPGGGCATPADVQAAVNQQTLYTKLDGQTYGIADLGYALNTQFASAELSRANQQAALVAQLTANATANQQAFAQTRYDIATDTNSITTAINQAAQNIMQNDNANYRQLHDENVAMQLENLRTQINQKDAQIFNLELRASQQEQNNYIVGQLKACPVPAYIVANPYVSTNTCGCGGCGC